MVYVAFQSIYMYNKFTHRWLVWKSQAKRVKHRSSNIFFWAWLKFSTRNLDEVKTNAIYFLSFSLWSNFRDNWLQTYLASIQLLIQNFIQVRLSYLNCLKKTNLDKNSWIWLSSQLMSQSQRLILYQRDNMGCLTKAKFVYISVHH